MKINFFEKIQGDPNPGVIYILFMNHHNKNASHCASPHSHGARALYSPGCAIGANRCMCCVCVQCTPHDIVLFVCTWFHPVCAPALFAIHSCSHPKLQEAADRFQLGSSLRWNGWGYLDTEFKVNDQKQIELTGTRYASSGKVLPSFREWAETVIGLNIDDVSVEQKKMPVPAVVNKYDILFSVLAYILVLSIFFFYNVLHG
jgi:hypothetical protein